MSGKNRVGAAEASVARYETYKKGMMWSLIGNAIMGVATVISILIAYNESQSKPEPRYFATREDGGIIPLVPVNRPFLNNGQVTNFAVEAITTALTMDFKNYREDMALASKYFQKPQGWNNFLKAIQDARVLELIQERKLISNAVANGASIVRDGVDLQNRYYWTVQIPLTVTYESTNQRSSETMIAELDVTRIPTWESSTAVGITRVTMSQRR